MNKSIKIPYGRQFLNNSDKREVIKSLNQNFLSQLESTLKSLRVP